MHVTGDPSIDQAISVLVERVQNLMPNTRIGFYLHGSWLSKVRYTDSDVDILALVGDPHDESLRAVAKQIGIDLAMESGIPLDFHIHPLDALEQDPYVDLRYAKAVGGVDLRPLLSVPTLDALTRESVAHVCQYVTDVRRQAKVHWPLSHPNGEDVFFGRLSSYSTLWYSKKLTYMASVRAACIHGISPTTAAQAVRSLAETNDAYADLVERAVPMIRGVEKPEQADHAVLREVCRRTLDYENDTLDALRLALEKRIVGEKCREVIGKYVDF